MQNPAEIYKLAIGITLTVAFVFTMIITLASLVGWVKFRYPAQQKVLFGILVVELCSAGVAMYKNMIGISPSATQEKIEQPLKEEKQKLTKVLDEKEKAVAHLRTQVTDITKAHDANLERLRYLESHMKTLNIKIPGTPP